MSRTVPSTKHPLWSYFAWLSASGIERLCWLVVFLGCINVTQANRRYDHPGVWTAGLYLTAICTAGSLALWLLNLLFVRLITRASTSGFERFIVATLLAASAVWDDFKDWLQRSKRLSRFIGIIVMGSAIVPADGRLALAAISLLLSFAAIVTLYGILDIAWLTGDGGPRAQPSLLPTAAPAANSFNAWMAASPIRTCDFWFIACQLGLFIDDFVFYPHEPISHRIRYVLIFSSAIFALQLILPWSYAAIRMGLKTRRTILP